MTTDKNERQNDAHRELAETYLAKTLAGKSVGEPTLYGRFERNPLEGEGPISIYRFHADLGTGNREPYYVVAGQTVANYYPDWALSPEEVFRLHLGTRFMLVMQVRQIDMPTDADKTETQVRQTLMTVNPATAVEDFRIVASFQVEEQVFVVCRCRFGFEEIYVFGRDCPPGISRRLDLPPHVAFRIHLGQYLQHELEMEHHAE